MDCHKPAFGHVPSCEPYSPARVDDSITHGFVEDPEVFSGEHLAIANNPQQRKPCKVAVVTHIPGNEICHRGSRHFTVTVNAKKPGVCMEVSGKPRVVMVYYHGGLGEVFHPGTEIAEQVRVLLCDLRSRNPAAYPQPETDPRPRHCMAEDGAGSDAVGVMVGDHLDVLLPLYLLCDKVRGGFK